MYSPPIVVAHTYTADATYTYIQKNKYVICALYLLQESFDIYLFIRPPDIVCRRTYILPGILSSSLLPFFRRLISELAEPNSIQIGHMVDSKCNLKTHVRNLGYPLPLQIGDPKNHLFGRLRNLTATLTAPIFRMKQDIDNRSSALTTTRGLLHRLKMSRTLVHKRLQTRPAFLPTLREFCILLHCQASQTAISKRNSTKLCQVMGSKLP